MRRSGGRESGGAESLRGQEREWDFIYAGTRATARSGSSGSVGRGVGTGEA